MNPNEPHERILPYLAVFCPRWDRVVASINGSDALQKKAHQRHYDKQPIEGVAKKKRRNSLLIR